MIDHARNTTRANNLATSSSISSGNVATVVADFAYSIDVLHHVRELARVPARHARVAAAGSDLARDRAEHLPPVHLLVAGTHAPCRIRRGSLPSVDGGTAAPSAGFAVRERRYAFFFPGWLRAGARARSRGSSRLLERFRLVRRQRRLPAREPSWRSRSGEDRPEPRASGARSGALLVIASGVSIVANYVFLLAAGRILGSEQYGSLAALLGVLAVVLIPASALQMAVSREISRRLAAGDTGHAHAFARRTLRVSAVWTVPLVVVAFALALRSADPAHRLGRHRPPRRADARHRLDLACRAGRAAGSQRFHALAVLYVVPFVLRLVVFAIAAAAGYRLGGAVFATVPRVAGTGMALVLIRAFLHRLPRRLPSCGRFCATSVRSRSASSASRCSRTSTS